MLFLRCYNLFKNECNGACQGCSDCPPMSASRLTWIKFAITSAFNEWQWRRVWKKHGKKAIEAILNSYQQSKVSKPQK